MNAENWEEGLKLTDQIIKDHGEFAYADYGAMFGGIYYNRGICLIRLRNYGEAAESFKTCHEGFPNKKPESQKKAPDSINPYEKTAVFQWALCKQLQEQYDEALKLYEKFLQLNPPKEELQAGPYFINLGICQANVGRLDDATASIKRVFDNQAAYRVKTEALLQGFVQLGGAWVRLAESNPEVLKTAHEFMNKYLPQLKMRPYDMYRFNPLVIQLAQDAGTAKMFELAIRYYGLFAGTQDAIHDLLMRSVEYGGITAKLQEEIDRLQKEIDGGDPMDVNVLRGLGAAYDGLGNARASYIIHQFLEKQYETSKYRPDILFQCARTATLVDDIDGTMEYSEEFLEKYPDHELFNSVSNLLVGALFEDREYQQCVDQALKVREKLDEGSAARDLMEFILGASYYYLLEYEKAQPILDAHVAQYPESQYLVNSRYFQASNLMKLDKYSEGAAKFDEYIAAYPASPLLDIAIFERAMCEYILQAESFDVALSLIDRLENEFPGSAILPNGLLLRGDIKKTLQELPAAEEAYLKAKTAADALGNGDVAGEALSRLVDTTVALERFEEAAKHYDEFFAKYPDSTHKLNVGVIGLDALRKLGRTEEGLAKLEELIVQLSREANAEGIEKAVNGYVTVSEEELGADTTLDKLNNFPGMTADDKTLRAWLIISKIDLLKGQLDRMKEDDPEYARKKATVDVAFNELKAYDRSELSNYILIQLGRYIVNTGNPFEAVPFFQEIGRNEEFEDFALLELAKIKGRSKKPEDIEEARNAFKRIIEVFGTKELEEEALLGLGDLEVSAEEWNSAMDYFQKYQKNKSFKRARPKANFMIGRCYEGKGELTAAQKVYFNVFVLYKGYLEWSAQAYLRNANIEWNKGTEESKRAAYEMLRDVERLLGPHVDTDKSNQVRDALRRLDEFRAELGITLEMEKAEEEAKSKAAESGSP